MMQKFISRLLDYCIAVFRISRQRHPGSLFNYFYRQM
jgi:hypothetical protein